MKLRIWKGILKVQKRRRIVRELAKAAGLERVKIGYKFEAVREKLLVLVS